MVGTGQACEWHVKIGEETSVIMAMIAAPQSKEFSSNLCFL